MMKFDWQGFRSRHSRLFSVLVILKRLRTKIGVVLVIACVGQQTYFRAPPFDLHEPNIWVTLGLLAIIVGSIVRLAALGCIHKKEALATTGVYALCRHPLYLGSILIALGFCVLLRDTSTYIVATAYFLVFYPLTIAWEENRLEARYGEHYYAYRDSVPLLLPIGILRRSATSWRRAMRRGGFTLLACECLMLAVVELMAETL